MLLRTFLMMMWVACLYRASECIVHPFVPLKAGNVWEYRYGSSYTRTLPAAEFGGAQGYLRIEAINSSTVLIRDTGTSTYTRIAPDSTGSIKHYDTTYTTPSSNFSMFCVDSLFFADTSGVSMRFTGNDTNSFYKVIFQYDTILLHKVSSLLGVPTANFSKKSFTTFLQTYGAINKIVFSSGSTIGCDSTLLIYFNGQPFNAQGYTVIDTLSQTEMENLYPSYVPKTPIKNTPHGLCGNGFFLAFFPAIGIGINAIRRKKHRARQH